MLHWEAPYMGKYQRWLIPILLLTVVAAWIVWPNNPGPHIHMGSFSYDRPLDFHLGLDLRGGV